MDNRQNAFQRKIVSKKNYAKSLVQQKKVNIFAFPKPKKSYVKRYHKHHRRAYQKSGNAGRAERSSAQT